MPYSGCLTTSRARRHRRHAYLLMLTAYSILHSPSKRAFSATRTVCEKKYFSVPRQIWSVGSFSVQPLCCTQIDGTVLLVKMPRSYCFLRTTFACFISTTGIFVLPNVLLQKHFDKCSMSMKQVIFKVNCTLFSHAMEILFICLSVCHFV